MRPESYCEVISGRAPCGEWTNTAAVLLEFD